MAKELVLEQVEELDLTVLDKIIEEVNEQTQNETFGQYMKKIGLTVGLVALTSIIATPVVGISYKAGTLLYAVGATSTFTLGMFFL